MTVLTVLLLPLVTALLIAVSGARRVQLGLALVGTVATFVAALFLADAPAFSVPWLEGFGIYFYLDPAGAASVLVLVAALVMIPTVYHAARTVEAQSGSFLVMLLAIQTGLNGIFLAKDLILFYVFWEATLIPSLLLLGGWGGKARRQAVFKYLLYAVTGSFLMLISILALKPLAGAVSYRFEDLLVAVPQLGLTSQLWLFTGFALGFAVKLPLWPLHSWLPDFHEQNHPSGAADVAGTLYKVGGWGFFAWALPLLPQAAEVASPYLMAFAAVTALYAAVIATAQTDLKRLLAYASLSHMGLVGVGLFGLHLAGLEGAVFLLAAQMLSTGGLFLLSGMLYARRETFALGNYGGLAKSAPALAATTLFILFASIGVPGLANFPGEFMALLGAFQSQAWLAALATLAVIAAGIYGVNLYQQLYQAKEVKDGTYDLRRAELLVLLPIIIGILWLGIFPGESLERIESQAGLAAQLEFPSIVSGGER